MTVKKCRRKSNKRTVERRVQRESCIMEIMKSYKIIVGKSEIKEQSLISQSWRQNSFKINLKEIRRGVNRIQQAECRLL
jgi:hypothetical protein